MIPTPLNPAMAATEMPPVMEARRWLQGADFPPDRPLINVSQAAPVDPPPLGPAPGAGRGGAARSRQPISTARSSACPPCAPRSRRNGPQPMAARSALTQVAITQGCNQAFCAVMSTLAGAGDEVISADAVVFQPQDVARHAGRHHRAAAHRRRPDPRGRRRRALHHARAPAPSCWSPPTTPAASNTRPTPSPPSATSPATTASP